MEITHGDILLGLHEVIVFGKLHRKITIYNISLFFFFFFFFFFFIFFLVFFCFVYGFLLKIK